MDSAQQLLFGEFPRAVGVTTPDWDGMELRQYLVHSELELDGVANKVAGNRNLYASLSAYKPGQVDGEFEGCAVLADKVSFDFDSSAKADPNADARWSHPILPDNAPDDYVVERMREDPDVRDAVLGDVCDDARRLATACIEEGIPVFGVFSGTGLHLHQLYQPTASRPGDKMGSNCRKWVSELTLSTADEKASGKPFRIMRFPNIQRIAHKEDSSVPTRLYTVPLKAAELAEIQPKDLLDLSLSPRPAIGSEPDSRPEMKVVEEYIGPGYEEGIGQEKMRPVPEETMAEEFAEVLVKEICRMPCVYERALGRNPPNDVRVKTGIMFLNAGYSPEETTEIIGQLNWTDFDRQTTMYQLKSLQESGKGDWSCKTMQAKGLCTRADDKMECPTYGYQGGNKPW